MEGLTTYSKFPVYPQPYTGSPNNSIIAYSHVGVGYTAATDSVPQMRSTHLEQNEGQPHLDDCGITPSPSGSSSSRSPAENSSTSKDAPFLSSNFDRLKDGVQGSHHTSGAAAHAVSPTPSDSAEASDSSNEDRLVVRIPRAESTTVPVEQEEKCNGTSGPSSSSPATASLISGAHGITVNLLDKELWQTFNSIGNEMIVTKPGR